MQKFSSKCIALKHSEQPLAPSIGQFNVRIVPVLGYTAQLVSPPPKIVRSELSSTLRAFNLAGSSMTCGAAYRLSDFVGVSPTRPSIIMEAPMMRAACKACVGFEDMHLTLSDKASECSDLSNASSTMIFPGWHCLAFVLTFSCSLIPRYEVCICLQACSGSSFI